MSRDAQAIAHHEAGHAVADVRFGFTSNIVTIIPNQSQHSLGDAGSVDGDYLRPNGTIDAERAGEIVIACLAGYAAEVQYAPSSKSQAVRGASDDFAKATDVLNILRQLGPIKDIKVWQQQARDFVKQNWKAIETVCSALLECKTLDGQSVEHIIEIADGKEGAAETLARWRELAGVPPIRLFQQKVRNKR